MRGLNCPLSLPPSLCGCNRHHALDKQLCRWLLLGLDRLLPYEVPGQAASSSS